MNRENLTEWLTRRVASVVNCDVAAIDRDQSLAAYGVESQHALEIAGDLESLLDRRLDPMLLYDYPTISRLVEFLGDETQSRSAGVSAEDTHPEDAVAIIGIGCKFPRASGPKQLWDLLTSAGNAISAVPVDRWSLDVHYDPEPHAPGKMSTRWGGFLSDVDGFDSAFFGISAAEAAAMDPQQRLLLEVTWEALEDAEIPPSTLAGKSVGVFVGISHNDYEEVQTRQNETLGPFSGTGNALSIAANRLSYQFDLRGPSIAVDTACSSSLVAAHLAVRSLRQQECSVALVAGANVILSPKPTIIFSKAGMMAADGCCKSFDESADGYVRGEGVGVVVFERLSDAVRKRRHIYAVVRGSALTQDGRTNGLTAPSGEAQIVAIRAAYRDAGIDPATLDFLEAHGTGTKLGDPIELNALKQVVRNRGETKPIWVGAIKSNIGHLEAAAGIAGLIKAALVAKHRSVPPNLHFTKLNPLIDLTDTSFRLPVQNQTIASETARAGVSGFGFGGTNCHVVLQGVREPPRINRSADRQLVLLSARTPGALAKNCLALSEWLGEVTASGNLGDMARALALGRDHHAFRAAFTCSSPKELIEGLRAAAHDSSPSSAAVKPPRLCFVYPGQGSQYPRMGDALRRRFPAFQRSLEDSARILQPFGFDLMAELDRLQGSRLSETAIAQPLIVAIQLAMTELLAAFQITPRATLGHSVGEVSAAFAAGALTKEMALRLALERGQAMSRAPDGGRMLAVGLSFADVQKHLAVADDVEIAADNAPDSIVLSGDAAALQALSLRLESQGVSVHWLSVMQAFHSKEMQDAARELREQLGWLTPAQANCVFISAVLGLEVSGSTLDAEYWSRNVRECVKFREATTAALRDDCDCVIEMGPHRVLAAPLRQTLDSAGYSSVKLHSAMRREDTECESFLELLKTLYTSGADPLWSEMFSAPGNRVALPAYSWQHDSELRELRVNANQQMPLLDDTSRHPLLGRKFAAPQESPAMLWSGVLSLASIPWLSQHRVAGVPILPIAAIIEMFAAVAKKVVGGRVINLRELVVKRAIRFESVASMEVLTSVVQADECLRASMFTRCASQSWDLCASVEIVSSQSGSQPDDKRIPESPRQNLPREVDVSGYYATLRAAGLDYGPAFQKLTRLTCSETEAFAEIDATGKPGPSWTISPLHLDSALQAIGAALPELQQSRTPWVPVGSSIFQMFPSAGEIATAHAIITSRDISAGKLMADVVLRDPKGALLAFIGGLSLVRLARSETQEETKQSSLRMYREVWRKRVRPSLDVGSSRRALVIALLSQSGVALTNALRSRGCDVVVASPGRDFRQVDDGHYEADLSRDEQLEKLFAGRRACGKPAFDTVVFMRAMDDPEELAQSGAAFPGSLLELSRLTRVLAVAQETTPPRLWVVTRGAQRVLPAQRRINPQQASAWGLAFGIAFEVPQLECARLDLDPDRDPNHDESGLAADLICSNVADADQLALRGEEVLERRIVGAGTSSHTQCPIHADAAYLVTGGCGALGLTVANRLVTEGARKLALICRREPSPEIETELGRLRSRGAEVSAILADVGDPELLEAAIARVSKQMGPIRGVFHAAGHVDDGPVASLRVQQLETTFRGKVRGALNLERALAGHGLDFFVMFSSASASLGSAGQGAYMAANAFLSAMAERMRLEGLPAVSIEWGPWAERGMAAEARRQQRDASIAGISMIDHDEGSAQLLKLLRIDPPRVLVLPFDLSQLLSVYPAAAGLALFKELLGDGFSRPRQFGGQAIRARPDLKQAFKAPAGEIESLIAGIWQRALRISPIGVTDSLFELGGDSVIANQIIGETNRALGVSIDSARAFQEFTVDRISRLVEERMLADIEQLSEEDAARLAGKAVIGESTADQHE